MSFAQYLQRTASNLVSASGQLTRVRVAPTCTVRHRRRTGSAETFIVRSHYDKLFYVLGVFENIYGTAEFEAHFAVSVVAAVVPRQSSVRARRAVNLQAQTVL